MHLDEYLVRLDAYERADYGPDASYEEVSQDQPQEERDEIVVESHSSVADDQRFHKPANEEREPEVFHCGANAKRKACRVERPPYEQAAHDAKRCDHQKSTGKIA